MFWKRLLPLFACNQFRLIIPFIYKTVFSFPLFYGDISYSIKKGICQCTGRFPPSFSVFFFEQVLICRFPRRNQTVKIRKGILNPFAVIQLIHVENKLCEVFFIQRLQDLICRGFLVRCIAFQKICEKSKFFRQFHHLADTANFRDCPLPLHSPTCQR